MSTNANIRIYREDGTRTGIYLHSDGYIDSAGVYLQRFYSTLESVEKLLALGNLSTIGSKIPEKAEDFMAYNEMYQHDYPDYDRDFCVPYTMWRGESFCQSLQDAEYVYIYIEHDRCWIVQEEQKIHSETLDEDWYGGAKSRFLIDAIREDVTERWWKEWEKEGVTLESCIQAAKDARYELERQRAAEANAYYRAYCD